MNSPLPTLSRFDINSLVQAISTSSASDALRCQFTKVQWDLLSSYMQPIAINSGQVLTEKGAVDRTLYLIESGTLSVHYEDEKGRVRIALVSAGSVLGEGAFFSHQPRVATVHAASACTLWCLAPMRFIELANRHSVVALELSLAMAAVMAKRLYNRAKRVAVT